MKLALIFEIVSLPHDISQMNNLASSLYQIIAKLLLGRLWIVLDETIHITKETFIHDRQIFDMVFDKQ